MTHFLLAGTYILMNQEDRVGMTHMVARKIAFQRFKCRQYNCPKALAADLWNVFPHLYQGHASHRVVWAKDWTQSEYECKAISVRHRTPLITRTLWWSCWTNSSLSNALGRFCSSFHPFLIHLTYLHRGQNLHHVCDIPFFPSFFLAPSPFSLTEKELFPLIA